MTRLCACGGTDDLVAHAAEWLGAGDDVVVLPTAAAYLGATRVAVDLGAALEPTGARLEALMVTDRASADEAYFATRVAGADWVVLADGSALHARSVMRASRLGEALSRSRAVVALGSSATLLGTHMVDPRGGAPTVGLGLIDEVSFTTPESDEQRSRTLALLPAGVALVEVAAGSCVLFDEDGPRDLGRASRVWLDGAAVGLEGIRPR